MHLTPHTLLQGRYRVVQLIAQGGMGAVYQATDERLGNRVALKQTLVSDPQLRAAFEREARLLAGLHHPALPVVSDHFAEGDGQFLVMQFIPGDDLAVLLQRRGAPFPLAEVLPWADRLLDALDYLHAQRPPIIHRDIKPQNLKLTARGEIVLLDFGLAKGEAGQGTATGGLSIFGYTPQYAPIEQIQGSGTGPRSDLYSVGATLYQLLTAEPPPDALTRAAAAVSAQPDPLRPAHALNPALPPALGDLLGAALALNPAERPDSAAALRAGLRALARTPDLGAAPTVSPVPLSSAGRSTIVVDGAGSAGQPTINIGAPTQRRHPISHAAPPQPVGALVRGGTFFALLGVAVVILMIMAAPRLVSMESGPAVPTPIRIADIMADSQGASRAAPLPPDGVAGLDGWDVQILEHARGEAALELLQDAPAEPDPAPEGWEYVLLKVRATHSGAVEQWAFDRGQIHVVGERAVAYDGFATLPPEPALGRTGEMKPGEAIEGWTAHLVRRDERDLVVCVGNLINEARYIALTPGASLTPDPELASAEPSGLGADSREPAAVGETVVSDRYEASVLELYRGDAAWERIYAGNRYNDPPAEGFEYVLARVRMRLIDQDDEPALLYSGLFSASSGTEKLDQPSIVEPDPELHEIVFPGGETEGWVAVQVRAGDPEARLVLSELFGDLSDSRKARFFALE